MKTTILIVIFLQLSISFLQGQDYAYTPFVEDGTKWSYAFIRQVGITDFKADYSIYHLQGDTVIDGLNYKKLFLDCSENYIAALREENKKIFIVKAQEEEKLLFDFNLHEGDWVDYLHQVTKIDTILIGNTKRKRFIFDSGYETWIEGIGSLEDFYPLRGRLLGYEGQGINYQKKGAELVYKTDKWYFNENDCKNQTSSYRSYFGKEFTHWYVVNYMIDAGRWSERYSVFNQDTLLNNGISYKKVIIFYSLKNTYVNSYYVFGIREEIETGSLFVALNDIYGTTDEISEILVSKMDLEIGDKYYFPPVRTDFNQPYCWHCFQDVQQDEKGYFATVDSIYYKDNRKHIRLDANYKTFGYGLIPLTFIEGIGPNVSFVPLINESNMAVCCNCYEDETGVWKSDIKDEYLDFSQADCFFEVTGGIPQIETGNPLKLIQRKGEIELQPDAGSFESGKVNVYSTDGKLIYAKPVQRNTGIIIPTHSFPNGTYVIHLIDERTKKTWSRKVVI